MEEAAAPGSLRGVAVASLTLGAAVGVFGFVFGVGAIAAGASLAQACVMSLLVFTGASQFSAVTVVADGGSTGAALGSAMLLAARNGVYGLAMSRIIGGSTGGPSGRRSGSPVRRSSGSGTSPRFSARWPATPSTRRRSASMPPSRPVSWPMVAPQLRHRIGLAAGVLGAVICLALIPFTPVGVPILCASLVGGRRLPPVVERCLALVPAALIMALVVTDTFSTGQDLVLDAAVTAVVRRVAGGA